MITEPPVRIRRVVFDHAARAAIFVYSHASSMVISPAAEADMIAMLNAARRDPGDDVMRNSTSRVKRWEYGTVKLEKVHRNADVWLTPLDVTSVRI
jgi:hypothetical protein